MFAKASLLMAVASILAPSSSVSATPISRTITKDIVIVGGGSGGTYAAVKLRGDYGETIALIEKESVLGGTVNTWIDPKTRKHYELGVEPILNYGKAEEFFARFNVSTSVVAGEPVSELYADFKTGAGVDYTAPTAAEQFAAFKKYVEIAEQYEDLMLPGLWNFPTPDSIPEDLLLDFGDFAKKYGIEAAVPQIWSVAAVGLGDVKKQPTFHVIQTFPAPLARAFIGQGQTLHVASNRNQDIYDRVADFLGDDVLYSSVVLISIPPTLANLAPFELDQDELDVFSKLKGTNAFAGAVVASTLPLNTSIINVAPSGDWLEYPESNFVQWFKTLDSPDRYDKVMTFGDSNLDAQGAKKLVERTYNKLVDAGSLEGGSPLEWLQFAEHGTINLRVTTEDLKAGFI